MYQTQWRLRTSLNYPKQDETANVSLTCGYWSWEHFLFLTLYLIPALSRTTDILPSHFAPQCTGRENTHTRSSRKKTKQNFYYLSFIFHYDLFVPQLFKYVMKKFIWMIYCIFTQTFLVLQDNRSSWWNY